MTKLHPDLEALMPVPNKDLTRWCGQQVYTVTQMREAILTATERAAKLCEDEVVEELTDGDLAYNMATRHCADAIRGTT